MPGPRAIASKKLGVLGFATPGPAGRSVAEALRALAAQGSPTSLISSLDVPAAAMMLIAGFYAALPALARRRGHDPDLPPSLRKVTRTL